ncbi:MAG: hypothetical protein GWP33_00505 [Alphaproteobacteria bacterium]|nr:hypothetical protein [Alphaproteobacteria bacterium]
MKVLFLANRPSTQSQAATVIEYLDAFTSFSSHDIYEVSMLHAFPTKLDLNKFDAIVTHYSLSLGPMIEHYLGPYLISQLKSFKGLKAAFLQDEYREIQTYWKHINELGIDVLFSCVPENEISKVYPIEKVPHLRVVNVLTGYVPAKLLTKSVLPVSQRPIDVGYRTRQMPFWLGRLGHEKWFIAQELERRASSSNFKLDLSTREGDRLYGDAWTNFVASCRAVIGVESGASIIDFDGKLEHQVDDYVAANPRATFEEVSKKFLSPYEGSLKLHQISPRCFEAAALRTPMVLFEGGYSGVLEPERHFIVLKKDFSNFDDVVSKLKDNAFLQAMADRVYEEVARDPRWGYRSFIQRVDIALQNALNDRATVQAARCYTQAEFDHAVKHSLNYSFRRRLALSMQSVLLGLPIARKSLFGIWGVLPIPLKRWARPLARIVSR